MQAEKPADRITNVRAAAKGPNLAPVQDYMKARDLYRQGQTEESLNLLCEAIGAEAPTPLLREHLDRIFEDNTPLADMVLHLALTQT